MTDEGAKAPGIGRIILLMMAVSVGAGLVLGVVGGLLGIPAGVTGGVLGAGVGVFGAILLGKRRTALARQNDR